MMILVVVSIDEGIEHDGICFQSVIKQSIVGHVDVVAVGNDCASGWSVTTWIVEWKSSDDAWIEKCHDEVRWCSGMEPQWRVETQLDEQGVVEGVRLRKVMGSGCQ